MVMRGCRYTGRAWRTGCYVDDCRALQVFRETARGTKAERTQLCPLLAQIDDGDVLMVTRFDRLAHSTRDLLDTLATSADHKADFRSLGDEWADTTTPYGRLMFTVVGGLTEFERELIRARTSEVRAQAVKLGQDPSRTHTKVRRRRFARRPVTW
jgi:DNA invertase Pin-like site-specific DNA recombinase